MKTSCWMDTAKVVWLSGLGIALASIFLGCSTTTVIRQGQEFILEEPAVLIAKDGGKLNVQHTRIRNDSISIIDSRAGRTFQMPLIEYQKLVVKKRVRGAIQVMIVFAGVGAALGAIPDPNCGDPCLFPNGGLGGSIFWAALAAPAGFLGGAILGYRWNYVFEQPAHLSDSISNKDEKLEF